jgi:hypothetical protein
MKSSRARSRFGSQFFVPDWFRKTPGPPSIKCPAPEPASLTFQSIAVGHRFEFHANCVRDGDDGASLGKSKETSHFDTTTSPCAPMGYGDPAASTALLVVTV